MLTQCNWKLHLFKLLDWLSAITIGVVVTYSFTSNILKFDYHSQTGYVFTLIFIVLTYFILNRLIKPAYRKWPLLTCLLVTTLSIFLAIIILIFSKPVWQWETGPESNQPPQIYIGSSWGSVERVMELHAKNFSEPNESSWHWQAIVDLSNKIKTHKDSQLKFNLTQPEWAVIDKETGKVIEGPDGVFIIFKAKNSGTWHVLEQKELNLHKYENQRSWQTVKLEIPANSEQLMVEVLPGLPGNECNNWNDRVWISANPKLNISNSYWLVNLIALSWLFIVFTITIWIVTRPIIIKSLIWLNYVPHAGRIDKRFRWVLNYIAANRLFRLYLIIIGILAILMIPIAISVAPWYYTATTPVQVKLEAPIDTQIELCWDQERQSCLPLVPYANSGEKKASLWLIELPPKPYYKLSIVFRGSVKDLALRGITLLNTQKIGSPLYQRTVDSFTDWFVPEGITVSRTNHAFHLTTETGGQLYLSEIIKLRRQPWLTSVVLWLLLVGAITIIGALGLPLLRINGIATNLAPVKFLGNRKLIWIAFGISITLQILLIVNSPILFDPDDSLNYGIKAVSIAELGIYDTGGYKHELHRLPGYPLLLAGLLKLSGYHLTTIAMLQGAMFGIAVLLLAISLRRWLHPHIEVIAIVIAILSPIQIWASRYILSESAFITFATLSLAAFFKHVTEKKNQSKMLWLIVYGGLATFTIFIRPNGIVLFTPLILLYLHKTIGALLEKGLIIDRIKSIALIALPYLLTILIFVGAIIGWSFRNYLSREYFGYSDVTGVYSLESFMACGFFDPTSLLKIGYPEEFQKSIINHRHNSSFKSNLHFYQDYMTGRYVNQYYYHAWHLRESMFNTLYSNGLGHTNKTISLLNNTLKRILSKSNTLLPWQAYLTSFLRVGWWAVALPDETTFYNIPIKNNYQTSFFDRVTVQDLIQKSIATLHEKLIYDMRNACLLTTSFSKIGGWYYEGYFFLLFIALVSSLYLLWFRQPILSTPFLIFSSNLILIVFLHGIRSRYIQILDIFLVFQSAIGISLFLNDLKKYGISKLIKRIGH